MFNFTSKFDNIVETNIHFNGIKMIVATKHKPANIFYRLQSKQYIWRHNKLGNVIPNQKLFVKFLG